MLHEEKRNGACGFFIKWESISKKMVLWASNGPPRMPKGHTPLDVIHFWCLIKCPFLYMQGKENAACGLFIKWKFLSQKYVP